MCNTSSHFTNFLIGKVPILALTFVIFCHAFSLQILLKKIQIVPVGMTTLMACGPDTWEYTRPHGNGAAAQTHRQPDAPWSVWEPHLHLHCRVAAACRCHLESVVLQQVGNKLAWGFAPVPPDRYRQTAYGLGLVHVRPVVAEAHGLWTGRQCVVLVAPGRGLGWLAGGSACRIR